MILVTGSSGLVGSEICRLLDESGLSYFTISRDKTFDTKTENVTFDLSGGDSLFKNLPYYPDEIIHLAAAIPQKLGASDNANLKQTNERIDHQIHEVASALCSHVTYFSTTSLYDLRSNQVQHEQTTIETKHSNYLLSKLNGENKFMSLNSTIFRIPSPVGKTSAKNENVLQHFLALAKNDNEIPIWGTGNREQNFISTSDIAAAVLSSIKLRPKGIFNIANEQAITMRGLAETITELVGKGKITSSPYEDPCEGEFARFSIDKANEFFGWRPTQSVSDIVTNLNKHG